MQDEEGNYVRKSISVSVGKFRIHVWDEPDGKVIVILNVEGYGDVRIEEHSQLDDLEAALRSARRAWFEAFNGVS